MAVLARCEQRFSRLTPFQKCAHCVGCGQKGAPLGAPFWHVRFQIENLTSTRSTIPGLPCPPNAPPFFSSMAFHHFLHFLLQPNHHHLHHHQCPTPTIRSYKKGDISLTTTLQLEPKTLNAICGHQQQQLQHSKTETHIVQMVHSSAAEHYFNVLFPNEICLVQTQHCQLVYSAVIDAGSPLFQVLNYMVIHLQKWA
ncbi:hypothetical protein niasHT_013826 [Heterodera trifolii]|uniref:Uncharacterized protein n=1 Tax=Heterodera trifolii TaxID=157864 RepID=A0ABD2KTQ2_9BILA